MDTYNWVDTMEVAYWAAVHLGSDHERVDVDVDTEMAGVRLAHPSISGLFVEITLSADNKFWCLGGPAVSKCLLRSVRNDGQASRIEVAKRAAQWLQSAIRRETEQAKHVRDAEHRLIDPALTDTPTV